MKLSTERPGSSPATPEPHGLPGLKAHLFALVLVVLVPALAFGFAASWEALRRQDRAEESRLLDTAQALAVAVDSEIRARLAALTVLATRIGDDPEAPSPEFLAQARTVADVFGGWVVLYRRDGSQIMNTLRPPGAPLPGGGGTDAAQGRAAVERVFASGADAVSDIVAGRVSGMPIAQAYVPVTRDGAVRAVLGIALRPADLSAILRGQAASGRGAVALTDARGVFAARSRDAERLVGQHRPARSDGVPPGPAVLRGQSLTDREPIRTARHPLAAAPGWDVWVNEPEATFTAVHGATIGALAGGGAVALGLGLLGAAVIARRLLRPVQALLRRAESVASGELDGEPAPPIPPAAVAEFERLRHAVTGAEAALRRVQRIGRVGGFEIDLTTGLNRRSAEYMQVQGRDARPAEERHADWVRRLHPEDRSRAERHFLAAVADGAATTEYEQEYRIVTPQGEVRWIYARAEIERDAAGRALRMIGAHVDVTALKAAEAALRDSETRLRLALDAAKLGAWEIDLVAGTAERTARALEIFGYGEEHGKAIFPSWRDRVHPEDRPALDAALEAVRTGRAPDYRVEYRFLRRDGRWVWIESHATGTHHDPDTGLPTRLIGTSLDVTERREAAERQAVLVHELDHRAKNTLAVVQAALRLTPRRDPEGYARAVEGRVGALARAHTLLARDRWLGAELREVAEEALAPFLDARSGPRAGFDGPPVALSPAAVQAISMAFHELATNASKHGALSVPGGHVALDWRIEDNTLVLRWRESGGPALDGSPDGRGFGSSLIEATIARQLNGELRVEWRPSGLLWEARLPLERLRPGARDLTARAAADRPAILVETPPG
ncbi:PAS domain-containing protein [Falsiroseomonas sp. HW251]|uniref:PAS domain-containing protein n=1 Tax=Falsiroseomonas sp. HW251 TaxID=3390998 RepID=UPI003D324078